MIEYCRLIIEYFRNSFDFKKDGATRGASAFPTQATSNFQFRLVRSKHGRGKVIIDSIETHITQYSAIEKCLHEGSKDLGSAQPPAKKQPV
jgi:hypothetical protein